MEKPISRKDQSFSTVLLHAALARSLESSTICIIAKAVLEAVQNTAKLSNRLRDIARCELVQSASVAPGYLIAYSAQNPSSHSRQNGRLMQRSAKSITAYYQELTVRSKVRNEIEYTAITTTHSPFPPGATKATCSNPSSMGLIMSMRRFWIVWPSSFQRFSSLDAFCKRACLVHRRDNRYVRA